ncbi:MAG: pilus assembly protein PilP [Candidatus Acidiferrales bacterium]
MTKLATQFVKSVAVLAVALSFGTAVLAQGKTAKKPRAAHRARKALAAKHVAKAAPAAALAPSPTNADSAAPAASSSTELVGKRDPFVALVNTAKGTTEHLPPGKAGLVIGTLTVQGTVQGANGMIAVIANPDQKVYFVRQGDRLYDGDVEKISLDEVTFEQNTKDAFGKPIERTVVKRIYPSAGEQQ